MSRLGGVLAVGGFAATVWYFFGPLGSVGWGPPGTEAYLAYERANRLASVPLLIHLAGWSLLVRDRGLRHVAAIGAAAARNLSWLSFLLGALAAIAGLIALAVRRVVIRGSSALTRAYLSGDEEPAPLRQAMQPAARSRRPSGT